MAGNNRAEVKIYGQQYTIAGTASIEDMERVAEYVDGIMNQLSKNLPSLTTMSLAVLTAVNTASEYFEEIKKTESLSGKVESMKKDIENYSRLWEEAKHSLLKYQEETRDGVEKLQDLQQIFNKKNAELSQMREALDEMTAKYQETLKLLKAAEEAVSQMEDTASAAAGEELDLLQEQNDTLQSENQVLQSENSTLRSEADELQKENEELRRKAEELEKKLREQSSGDSAEPSGMSDFYEKYKELENSFFDIQMENIQLKNELDEYRKQDS